MIGTRRSAMPMNISSRASDKHITSVAAFIRAQERSHTSKGVAGCVLRSIYIADNYASKVGEGDLHRNAYASLIVSHQVVWKPDDSL